jgi:hypothetical protein
MGASVKIMLSYDYCHFEVCKSTDENLTDKEINELRKETQRLADEAVRQYKIARRKAELRNSDNFKKEIFLKNYGHAVRKMAEDRSPEEIALVKQRNDKDWEDHFNQNEYDYQDDDGTYNW